MNDSKIFTIEVAENGYILTISGLRGRPYTREIYYSLMDLFLRISKSMNDAESIRFLISPKTDTRQILNDNKQ